MYTHTFEVIFDSQNISGEIEFNGDQEPCLKFNNTIELPLRHLSETIKLLNNINMFHHIIGEIEKIEIHTIGV